MAMLKNMLKKSISQSSACGVALTAHIWLSRGEWLRWKDWVAAENFCGRFVANGNVAVVSDAFRGGVVSTVPVFRIIPR